MITYIDIEEKNTNANIFIEQLRNSIKKIEDSHNNVSIECTISSNDWSTYNGKQGRYIKYNVVIDGGIVYYLETFNTLDFNYFRIFTSIL